MEDRSPPQLADTWAPPPKSSGSLELGNRGRRGVSESRKSPLRAYRGGFRWAPLSIGECIGIAILVLLIYLVLSVQQAGNTAKQNGYAMRSTSSKQTSDTGSPPLGRDAFTSSYVVGSNSGLTKDKELKKAILEEMAKGNVDYQHVCGRQWRRQYADLQKEILGRGADQPRRFLISRQFPTGGIGDRLIGMVSLFVNALLTKRAFIIEWESLDEFLAPNEIDWRISPQMFPDPLVHNLTPEGQTFWNRKFPPGAAEVMSMTDKIALIHAVARGGVPSLEWFRNGTDTHDVVIAKSNRGTLVNYYNDPATAKALTELGLYPPFAFGCVLRYLFRPSEKFLAGLDTPTGAKLMDSSNFRVGIHARIGDNFFVEHEIDAPEQLTGDTLLECAKRVTEYWAPAGKKVVWYFMSDSPPLRRAIKAKYGDIVVTSDVTPVHIVHQREAALFAGLLEWYMFSLNDFFIFTESGMAKSASFFSLHQMAAFQFPRLLRSADDLNKSCDPSQPKSVFQFKGWSGL